MSAGLKSRKNGYSVQGLVAKVKDIVVQLAIVYGTPEINTSVHVCTICTCTLLSVLLS